MQKGKKVVLGIIIIAVLAGAGFGGNYLMAVNKYKKTVQQMSIQPMDLSKVPDGTYTGRQDVDFISAEVKVTVQGHKITEIELVKHKNERGKPAEVILERVKSTQSLNVDSVSGATNSSKVILKAVQNALEGK